MQTVGLVTVRNRLCGDRDLRMPGEFSDRCFVTGQVGSGGHLEKAAGMTWLAHCTVVFDGPHAVGGRARRRRRIPESGMAPPAVDRIPPGRTINVYPASALRT